MREVSKHFLNISNNIFIKNSLLVISFRNIHKLKLIPTFTPQKLFFDNVILAKDTYLNSFVSYNNIQEFHIKDCFIKVNDFWLVLEKFMNLKELKIENLYQDIDYFKLLLMMSSKVKVLTIKNLRSIKFTDNEMYVMAIPVTIKKLELSFPELITFFKNGKVKTFFKEMTGDLESITLHVEHKMGNKDKILNEDEFKYLTKFNLSIHETDIFRKIEELMYYLYNENE